MEDDDFYADEAFLDDAAEWETEQVFRDDEFGDFGVDGMGPEQELDFGSDP